MESATFARTLACWPVLLACFGSACAAADGGVPAATAKPERVTAAAETLVIAEGEQDPRALAIDDTYVYWVAGPAVRRAPLEGGAAETLSQASPLQLAAADGAVYFTDLPGGKILRVDGDGSEHTIGSGVQPVGIAVHEGRVFWTNSGMTAGPEGDGSLASARSDGSDAQVLVDKLSQPWAIAVDAQNVYFSSTSQACAGQTPPGRAPATCSGGGVLAAPRAGGAPFLIDSASTPTYLGLGADALFWFGEYPTRLLSAPLTRGGAAREVAALRDERPGPLVVADDSVYFSSSERGRVLKLPLGASTPTPIAVDLGQVGGIAVDARGVYVAASSQGRIVRFPKDGSAARAEPVAGPCPTPLGTAEEVAATPREDVAIEQLALRLDGQIMATQATYERVQADVSAVRAVAAELADIDHRPRDDGRQLLLRMSELAYQAVEAGDYTAWDCLNDFYRVTRIEPMNLLDLRLVLIELEGTYELSLLGELYTKLPGVLSAEANSAGGDGPTICARRQGETFEYVFDRRSGDCLGGCTEHDAQRFVSTAPGTVEARERWVSSTQLPAPAWFTETCRRP
jgi:hypothetical protein